MAIDQAKAFTMVRVRGKPRFAIHMRYDTRESSSTEERAVDTPGFEACLILPYNLSSKVFLGTENLIAAAETVS